MRKIHLTNYKRPIKTAVLAKQRLYSVYLNNKFFYFKSEKDAVKLLAETNKFLNDMFATLNRFNADLYFIYRQVYFYFDHATGIENTLLKKFAAADDNFKRLLRNTYGQDGNSFAFNFMASSINIHLDICKILDLFLIDIREDSQRINVKILAGNITRLQDLLKNYPTGIGSE